MSEVLNDMKVIVNPIWYAEKSINGYENIFWKRRFVESAKDPNSELAILIVSPTVNHLDQCLYGYVAQSTGRVYFIRKTKSECIDFLKESPVRFNFDGEIIPLSIEEYNPINYR